MGKVLDFIRNKEPLKLAIMDYEGYIDVIYVSYKYYKDHRDIFRRKADKEVSEEDFRQRLYEYIWTPKISEMLVILYLERLDNRHPTIYELNKLLKRTINQYSSTYKAVSKLKQLDIVRTVPVESDRKDQQVMLTDTVCLYGYDEFREMMLEEWDTDAKEYMQRRLKAMKKDKARLMKEIKMIKKGRRMK